MKDVLIITNYFPPEIGAASNRIFHLTEGLNKRDYKITVIAPLPNYPTGEIFKDYKGKFSCASDENGIKIHRLWVYASNSKNIFLRLLAMLSYCFSLLLYFATNKIPKTVIVQSPPLLVSFTSMFFLNLKKRRLILNVSDLWPLAGLELGVFKRNQTYNWLEKIERFNYRKANLVMGQSEEILTHVKSIYPNKETFLYRNYPNFNSLNLKNEGDSSKKIKIVYAGLLGVAQGVHKLCQHLDYDNIEFHIYGSGSELKDIEKFIRNNPNLSIIYHGEMLREELHKSLRHYDLAIIPLAHRIYGSVPSKIFEYSKLGLPILYFGGGEGEIIIKKYSLGWIAESGNYYALNKVIATLKKSELNSELKRKIKETAALNFNFDMQINELMLKI